jgi:hypothetical protein
MRHGSGGLAQRQAFYIMAVPGAGQQDLGRKAAVFENAQIIEPSGACDWATTLGRSDTALGAFYRRLSARAGKAKAVTATARKIAVLFYNSLRYGMAYHDPGATQYEERYRSRVIGNLQRRAKAFGSRCWRSHQSQIWLFLRKATQFFASQKS